MCSDKSEGNYKTAIPQSDAGGRSCTEFLNTVDMKRTGRSQ